MLPLLAVTALGEDRVTFQPVGTSSPITMIGTIMDYTGRDLLLRALDGNPQYIPSEEIVEVNTHYNQAFRDGITDYEQHQIDTALQKFIAAYDQEPRAWVDREIASWIVRLSLATGDESTAFRYFREIIKTDPQSRHWGIAPLIWSPRKLNSELLKSFRPLLISQRPGDRLLATSVLLFDEVSGTLAERELGILASDPNPCISRLARAQLWRASLAKNEITDNILENWREQIDQMPSTLRPGPQYLLGRGFSRLGEPRLAAAEFLKLTILYGSQDSLTARATLEAAESVERTGLTQEANLLYREMMVRFPWSPEVNIAQKRLAESTPTPTPSPTPDK